MYKRTHTRTHGQTIHHGSHQIGDMYLRASVVLVPELHHLSDCKADRNDHHLRTLVLHYTAHSGCFWKWKFHSPPPPPLFLTPHIQTYIFGCWLPHKWSRRNLHKSYAVQLKDTVATGNSKLTTLLASPFRNFAVAILATWLNTSRYTNRVNEREKKGTRRERERDEQEKDRKTDQ